MAAKSKLTYKVYEHRGSGRWHWEVATAEGQVVERGRARSAIEARAEAVIGRDPKVRQWLET